LYSFDGISCSKFNNNFKFNDLDQIRKKKKKGVDNKYQAFVNEKPGEDLKGMT
jgi:hypothetical protein